MSAEDARQPNLRPFTLYAAGGRIYARNPPGRLIDLGAVERAGDGHRYLLDGDKRHGEGLDSEEAVLRRIGETLDFTYLDGQFTSLPDVSDSVDLADAVQHAITLDEFADDEDPSGRGARGTGA
ncbi:hypothetical protein [Coralloluteibacterium thermophilus]|uniref:Uncharacterized protein n=1 Tax=Coralloluteibacterium thermophilum TaxID=2707049 RepID=A0ABV9NRT2_9GAMM